MSWRNTKWSPLCLCVRVCVREFLGIFFFSSRWNFWQETSAKGLHYTIFLRSHTLPFPFLFFSTFFLLPFVGYCYLFINKESFRIFFRERVDFLTFQIDSTRTKSEISCKQWCFIPFSPWYTFLHDLKRPFFILLCL